jgi:sortase A
MSRGSRRRSGAPGGGAGPKAGGLGGWSGVLGRRRRWAPRILLTASIAALVAGTAIAAQIGWFLHDSSVHGAALIHQFRQAMAAESFPPAACQHTAVGRAPAHRRAGRGGSDLAAGLLEIPALGLVAPVRQGASDAVLKNSVGHVRASVWPGRPGASVLSAHDVTWFSRIGSLNRSDVIRYLTPCRAYTYRVTSHRVVQAGYRLYNSATPTMILETCYPLDALYLTGARYLVFAVLASTAPTPQAAAPPRRPAAPALTVPAPRALAAQGLSLRRNQAPLATLSLSGAASLAWRQTNAPLRAEASALAEYFGLIRSAGQQRQRWWADLAPSVPVSAAAGLWGGQIAGYDRRIAVRLRVRGDRILGATLTAVLTTSGSARPGSYRLKLSESVTHRGELLVSGLRMRAPRS